MNYCPCCSNLLLEHIRHTKSYWFCRHCWQEMPVYTLNESSSLTEAVTGKISKKSQKEKRINTTVYANQLQPINEWIGLQNLSA